MLFKLLKLTGLKQNLNSMNETCSYLLCYVIVTANQVLLFFLFKTFTFVSLKIVRMNI